MQRNGGKVAKNTNMHPVIKTLLLIIYTIAAKKLNTRHGATATSQLAGKNTRGFRFLFFVKGRHLLRT